jgi:thymidylate synthase
MEKISVLSSIYCSRLIDLTFAPTTVSPRGLVTYERENSTFTVDNPNQAVIKLPKRGLSYRFMAAEAWWILSGSDKLNFHEKIREKLGRFSDDGEVLAGAYGPKVMGQILYVVSKLIQDQDSRQAVLTIWRENPRESKDIPCTIALQFRIRKNKLNCTAFMRSSDMYLGIPYDVFSFSCIMKYVQIALFESEIFVDIGNLCIFMGSSHLYSTNEEDVEKIAETPWQIDPTFQDQHVFRLASHELQFTILHDAANARDEDEAYRILCKG